MPRHAPPEAAGGVGLRAASPPDPRAPVAASAPGRVVNAMTVDVEEHFQVSAFAGVVPRGDWDRLPSRVAGSTARLLELFAAAGVRATFFVLGWIGQRHPDLVRRIAAGGHEVACHGWAHDLIYSQSPETFAAETRRAKQVLEDAGGCEVRGYRAASFSITRRSLWALDVLAELGFAYDSSIFPVVHDRYGMPGAPRTVYRVAGPAGGRLVEVPPCTVRVAGMTLPAAGGGYLRLLPLWWTRWAIARINRERGAPAVVYVHPWEVDPEQPRIRAPWASRQRHYVGLAGTEVKLRALMARFAFAPLAAIVAGRDDIPDRRLP